MPRLLVPAIPKEGEAPPTKKEYILTSGTHRAPDDKGNWLEYSVGERVPLTEVQYASFKDKFVSPDSPEGQRFKGAGSAESPPESGGHENGSPESQSASPGLAPADAGQPGSGVPAPSSL